MKKGIIAVSLLLAGALLITPITNAISQEDVVKDIKPINAEQTKVSQVANVEKTQVTKDNKNNTIQTEEQVTSVKAKDTVSVNKTDVIKDNNNKKEEVKVETTKPSDEVAVEESQNQEVNTGMTKSEAEAVLNRYIKEVEKTDLTYTYQGDENTFKAIKDKGMRGYVFLPNADTDLAYLVDKDNGNIYYFHPSGYFELLQ